MKKPLVSVIIATYNSSALLPRVLGALAKQTYPRTSVEVIFMDGGSTDTTLSLAKKYKCRVIHNPQTEPVYGKFLGYTKARGKYLMYLDHDEVLKSTRSIEKKVAVLENNSEVKAVAGGNYVNPKGYPFINEYINDFGDPFSFFIYRLSKRNVFFFNTMKKRYPVVTESRDACVFDLSSASPLPLIELVAGGSLFDAAFLKRAFPQTKKDYSLLPHFFYFIYSQFPNVALIKNDPIAHYSADVLKKYFKKISWRVKNNIFHTSTLGASGFTGREQFQPPLARMKKYLFIPYAFSIVLPFIDSVFLARSRKTSGYLLHVPFTIYTALLIVYYYTLKMFGVAQGLQNYDGTKTIAAKKIHK